MGKQCQTLLFGAPKSLQVVTATMKLREALNNNSNRFIWKDHLVKHTVVQEYFSMYTPVTSLTLSLRFGGFLHLSESWRHILPVVIYIWELASPIKTLRFQSEFGNKEFMIWQNAYLTCLCTLYAEYILRNSGLEEAQAGIKIAVCRRPGFCPWVGTIPWRREWLSTSVFLPRKSHGQRGLVGYSPRGHKKSWTWLSS